MMNTIHVVIADPSTILRSGLVLLLERSTMFSAEITEVSTVAMLPNTTFRSLPDVLIVNPMQLGAIPPSQLRDDVGSDGLKVIALQSTLVDPSVLNSFDDTISIFDSAEVIVDKILKAVSSDEQLAGYKELSQREKEIIVCVVKGMTNKQIADSLYLSAHTIIAHRRNIANKLQIHSPSGLTIYAIVNKLVDLADVKNSISQSRVEE